MDGPRSGYGRMEGGMGRMGNPRGMGGMDGQQGGGYGGGMRGQFGARGGGSYGMNNGPLRQDFGPPGPARGTAGLHSHAMPVQLEPSFTVDREKTCPLLLRVWVKTGSHHRLEDFAVRGKEPPGDIHIYTWMDATLRELSDLIKEVYPGARARGSRLSFAVVYPDRNGRNVMRQLGLVHSTRQAEDDNKSLKSLKFQTGDLLDVAVLAGF